MNPIIYGAGESSFTSNGLGRLSEAILCQVTEELNGIYEAEVSERRRSGEEGNSGIIGIDVVGAIFVNAVKERCSV